MDQYITLITALLSAALGGFVALVSVFFTNRGNTARLKIQLDSEERKRKQDLLRGRGEELYELIDKWSTALFSYYMALPLVLQGTLSYNELLDFQIKQSEKGVDGNFARIEMLIDVYFPEVRSAYDDLIKGRDKINAIVLEHKRASQAGMVDSTVLAEQFNQRQSEVLQAAKKLKAQVLERIRAI